MNGDVEMASEVRRTLILCPRSAFEAAPISSAGSAVDSTYFLQTDLWTGMISGVLESWTNRDLPPGNADRPSHRGKSHRGGAQLAED